VRKRNESSPSLLLQAIGFTLDVDGGGMMQESVQDRTGNDRVPCEDGSPISIGLVGGEDNRAFFISPRDQLEEEVGGLLVQREIPDFVEDEELRVT